VIPRDFPSLIRCAIFRSMMDFLRPSRAPPSRVSRSPAYPELGIRTRRNARAPSPSSPTPSTWNARSITFRNFRGRCQRSGNQPLAASCLMSSCPLRVRSVVVREDVTLVTHRAAVWLAEVNQGVCGCRCCRSQRLTAAPRCSAAALSGPLRRRVAPRRRAPSTFVRREGARGGRQCFWRRPEEEPDSGCRVMLPLLVLGNPCAKYARNRPTSVSWPSRNCAASLFLRHGAGVSRARPRKHASIASEWCCCPLDLH